MAEPSSPQSAPANRLAGLLVRAAAGQPPPADGGLEVLPPIRAGEAAVLGFYAHHVVVADLDPEWVRAQPGAGDLSERFCPPFLSALSAKLARRASAIDAVYAAWDGRVQQVMPDLIEVMERSHPRVARALRYRDDVRVWRTTGPGPGGLVLLGRGLAGRIETAVEVDAAAQGRGLGRTLFAAARTLIGDYAAALGLPPRQPVWAQVAPANVPSVRALMAPGFVPIGAEALFVTQVPARSLGQASTLGN